MSNVARVAGQAANTLSKPLSVEDVFSTYLYNGTATNVSHQIQNGIDLAGEGGLVWIKKRDSNISNTNHHLVDTERGDYYLASNSTNAQASGSDINTFNSDGWTFDASTGLGTDYLAAQSYASWTFRKAPKFFDVVTYTGDGVAGRTVSHNLGTTVGSIFIKELTQSDYRWMVYHRSLGNGGLLRLDSNGAASYNNTAFNSTDPASDLFTLGDSAYVNGSGKEYVAYLFAHNDGDGEFGPDGDADIIKCGSFTTDSGGNASVDIGFEPQWIIYKRSDGTSNWGMNDNMRGWADTYWNPLYADVSNAESGFAATRSWPTATGFEFEGQLSASANYIYIAIRRGPMAVPESATDVFDVATRDATEPGFDSSFPVDFALIRTVNTADNWWAASRLNQGKYLQTNLTNAEASASSLQFDYMDGWNSNSGANSDLYSWMWKRAPNFFDAVAYTGNGTAGRTVSHNLGVAPEMMWIKNRDGARNWAVYHKELGGTKLLYLNGTNASITESNIFNNTDPTESVFTLGSNRDVNSSISEDHIAYLFASLDGVSKVGSYTGNGTSTGDAQNIDCGFSSGARFILIKATSVAYSWMLFDTERGITSGNDSLLILNDTDAETTAFDSVDPYSSGFTAVQGPYNMNQNGVEYIFYAIA